VRRSNSGPSVLALCVRPGRFAVSWQEFNTDSTFERDVPGADVAARGHREHRSCSGGHRHGQWVRARMTVRLGTTGIPAQLVVLVDRRLRSTLWPLLFGAARRVLGLLFDAALAIAGETSNQGAGRWSIEDKAQTSSAVTHPPGEHPGGVRAGSAAALRGSRRVLGEPAGAIPAGHPSSQPHSHLSPSWPIFPSATTPSLSRFQHGHLLAVLAVAHQRYRISLVGFQNSAMASDQRFRPRPRTG
jgi:hypothetical protein